MKFLLLIAFLGLAAAEPKLSKDYCIVGAGVSGVQTAYFMQKLGMDYVVLERNGVPASFYTKFPRHGTLISINKINTGRINKEFNFRHDWNSLITDDESLLFKELSKEYFAPSKLVVTMLQKVVQRYQLNIQFNTDISNIRRQGNSETCQYAMNDQKGNDYCCKVLIMAAGLWDSKRLSIPGAEYIEDYTEFSVNADDYANKHVLILGFGNSAFETAKQLYYVTADTHMLGKGPVRQSIETHYVGDVRSINNEMMDSHILKTLDGIMYLKNWRDSTPMEERSFNMLRITRGTNGKLYLKSKDERFAAKDQSPLRQGYDHILGCIGFQWQPEVFANSTQVRSKAANRKNRLPPGKYPDIDYNYESTQHPNLFFAGTMTHSLDFRKSAGGFIHGFRYTAKTLTYLLNNRYELNKWPAVTLPYDQLIPSLLKRINEASGPYQMYGALGDMMILDIVDRSFRYMEDVPLNLVHDIPRYLGHDFDSSRHRLLTWTFEFGANFSKDHGADLFAVGNAYTHSPTAHKGTFLHPVLYYYNDQPKKEAFKQKKWWETMPQSDKFHAVIEDLNLHWEGYEAHLLPLRKFIESITSHDLRQFRPSTCISVALGSANGLPIECMNYANSM